MFQQMHTAVDLFHNVEQFIDTRRRVQKKMMLNAKLSCAGYLNVNDFYFVRYFLRLNLCPTQMTTSSLHVLVMDRYIPLLLIIITVSALFILRACLYEPT